MLLPSIPLGGLALICAHDTYLAEVEAYAFATLASAPLAGALVGSAGYLISCLLPILVYPDLRASNTAWSECVLFAAVFLGFSIGSATSPYAAPSPPCEASIPHLLVGLAALGVGRTLLSAVGKLMCGGGKRLKDANGKDTMTNVVRSFCVTVLTAGAIAGAPPPCSWW